MLWAWQYLVVNDHNNANDATHATGVNDTCLGMSAWIFPASCKQHLTVPWLRLPLVRAACRCAYRALASAADPAVLDGNIEDYSSSNNNKGGVVGYNNDNNRNTTGDRDDITSTSTTDTVNNIDTLASEKRSHRQRTLCILDDPLTALDAETRGHVVQRCIHGLLRRVPGVAVVVTCGEIDESESESNLVSNHRTRTVAEQLMVNALRPDNGYSFRVFELYCAVWCAIWVLESHGAVRRGFIVFENPPVRFSVRYNFFWGFVLCFVYLLGLLVRACRKL